MTDSPKGFLSRWRERKEAVAEEERTLEVDQLEEAKTSAQIEGSQNPADVKLDADEQPTQLADIEELPDPESIEVGGSFASFMAEHVDPTQKAAALRALWKQPHYNEIDGLLEYALDYTNQPLLADDVSAELAQKVFRHVTKDEPEEEEEALIANDVSVEGGESSPENVDVQSPEIQQNDTLVSSDNLTDESLVVSQNEPDVVAVADDPVV